MTSGVRVDGVQVGNDSSQTLFKKGHMNHHNLLKLQLLNYNNPGLLWVRRTPRTRTLEDRGRRCRHSHSTCTALSSTSEKKIQQLSIPILRSTSEPRGALKPRLSQKLLSTDSIGTTPHEADLRKLMASVLVGTHLCPKQSSGGHRGPPCPSKSSVWSGLEARSSSGKTLQLLLYKTEPTLF